MHGWRGILCHTIMVSAQPLYLALRRFLNPSYFSTTSKTWLALTLITWLIILTQATIPYYRNPLRHLPTGPNDTFPIGHMNFNGGRPPTENIEKLFKDTPNDGIIVCWGPLYLGNAIFATRPDILAEMLNTNNYDWEKPPVAKRFLRRTLGEGLVNVEGNQHKAMRKAVAPAFSGHHIRELVPLFYSKGLQLAESMAREIRASPDSTLEISAPMSRVTLDIIGAAGIGKDFNTMENDDDALAKCYDLIANKAEGENLLVSFLIAIYLPTWAIGLLKGTIYSQRIRAQAKLRREVRALLQQKKQRMAEKSTDQKDIISIIMRSGNYSDDYLVDQLLTFLAAGHDTTASALTWTLYLLCLHPHMQDRLREECNAVLSQKTPDEIHGSTFDAETMPYLTAICSETLRLYPTVPATSRHSVKPTTLGGVQIPLGTEAVVSAWAINREPVLWGADADKFNPDRWLEKDNGGAKSPYSMVTFLHGPRSCIGQTFARTEMKCLLASMIWRFRFELADPDATVEPVGMVTIKPRDGLRLKLFDLQA